MREKIYHVAATASNRVVITGVPEELTLDNVLGILNETTGKKVYTPLDRGKNYLTVIYTASQQKLQLQWSGSGIHAGDQLLVKTFTDTVESDAATDIASFFGIVSDGETVKVVTEDGGEEVVEPVGLMDEDDVYDYLEDIAVLMGGITAQQAASITAATRAIIHGGSGSGEGGEGGSGSGSGE